MEVSILRRLLGVARAAVRELPESHMTAELRHFLSRECIVCGKAAGADAVCSALCGRVYTEGECERERHEQQQPASEDMN